MAVRERQALAVEDAPGEERCPGCGATADAARCGHCGAARRVNGYRIRRLIAQGPHSRIYEAVGPDHQKVALKELVFALVPDVTQLEAFEREAEILKTLDHPRIPKFIDSFQEGAGIHTRLYLAQQFVEGRPLSTLADTAAPVAHVEAVARDVLDVLAYLHSRQPKVLHRDIKPANLILGDDGRVKVVDFGAALAHPRGATHGATLVGTFGYMPPEQLGGTVDETCDLYALGASLLHLLTGRPPHEFFNSATEIEIPSELEVPERLRIFLHGLTARNRRDRYRTAAMARRALDGLEALQLSPADAPRARRTMVTAALAATALALVGAGIWAAKPATADRSTPQDWSRRPAAPVVSDRVRARWTAHDAPITAIASIPLELPDGADQFDRPWVVITGSDDGTVRARTLQGSEESGSLVGEVDQPVQTVATSHANGLVGAGTDSGLVVWRADTLARSPRDVQRAPNFRQLFRLVTDGGVAALAFSPDGADILIGGADDHAKQWALDQPSVVRQYEMIGGTSAVAFTPDGRAVVLGSARNDGRGVVAVFDSATAERRLAFAEHTSMVHAIAVSPNGRVVASASADSTWLWTIDGKWRAKLPSSDAAGRVSLAFSSSGAMLARADSAGGVEVFDVRADPRLLASLVDDVAMSVNAVVFLDWQKLAAAGNDRQVRVWQVPTGPVHQR